MGAEPRRDLDARRGSFLARADDYERHRPGYPIAAIIWTVGTATRRVIDVGCGPGNLTGQLAKLGHLALGVDPSAPMLKAAQKKGLLVLRGAAESLPLTSGCADVVTAATAFHWFDHERAVPEMRRVLRRGGRAALLTNIRDESVPWVRALSEIVGSEAAMAVTIGGAEGMEAEFVPKLERGGLFHSTEYRVFNHEQELTPEGLVGLVRSRSYIAVLPDAERGRLLDGVRTLCREHPQVRNRESFVMPYKTHALRALAA